MENVFFKLESSIFVQLVGLTDASPENDHVRVEDVDDHGKGAAELVAQRIDDRCGMRISSGPMPAQYLGEGEPFAYQPFVPVL